MNGKKLRILCITGITALSIILVVVVCWIYKKNDGNINDDAGSNHQISRMGDRRIVENVYTNSPLPTVTPENDGGEAEDRIKPDTKYILQSFYVNGNDDNRLTDEELPVPAEIIALNEDELQNYIDEYMKDIPLEEYLNGIISYEIISFDENEVILRKTYSSNLDNDKYYICDSGGEIVVFYSDKKTVYEYTGITTDELSDADKIKLGIGYYVNDLEELYALLESYSS